MMAPEPVGSPPVGRSLLYTGFSAATSVLLLLLLIVAGRLLGSVEYGKLAFVLALATVFETLVDFGLKEVTTRAVARDRAVARRFLHNTFALKLLGGAASLGVMVVALRWLRPEADVRAAGYLLGVAMVVRSYVMTIRSALYGFEQFGLDSVIALVDRGLLFALAVLALGAGYGLLGVSWAFVVARLLTLAFGGLIIRTRIGTLGFEFDLAFWRQVQLAALPFGAFAVVLNLYNYVDTLMLGVLRDDHETGLYNAAYRIYEGFINVPSIIGTVLVPRLAREFLVAPDRHRRLAARGVGGAVALAVPAAIGVSWWAPSLLVILFGGPYRAATRVLQLLAWGFVVTFPLHVLQAVAVSANAERALLATALLGCLANVALNAVAIPAYGMHGAAAATVASEALSLAVLYRAIRRGGGGAGREPSRETIGTAGDRVGARDFSGS